MKEGSIPRDAVWLLTYLTSLHAMLPFPMEISASESRIPLDAETLANEAVKQYDNFLNKGEDDARRE